MRRETWWQQTLEEAKLLVKRHRLHLTSPSAETSESVQMSVHSMWEICVEHFANQALLLDYSLPFQRGFERNYEWKQSRGKGGKRQPSVNFKDFFVEDNLFWSVSCLAYDEFQKLFTGSWPTPAGS